MQTMSSPSPSMSDAADTPMSGSCGSPSPQSPLSTSTKEQILDFSKKDCSSTGGDSGRDSPNGLMTIRSPKTTVLHESSIHHDNERSVNSSPATLVPTPRSTPPVNGILTPPNDIEGTNEPSKLNKPGGRLKFFKDGVLCLELTHHGEGEKTKWTQIRCKTVFPKLIHTVKEATIPCHSTPSSFASPSSLTHNHRVESSTSHSLSDDACSMLSSPRIRESHWKQSVPQRGVSACLQFYMKPAPCALKFRELSQDQKRKRWPYNYNYLTTVTEDDKLLKLKNSVQCSCDDEQQSRVLTDHSSSRILSSAAVVNNNNNDDESSKPKSPTTKDDDDDIDDDSSKRKNDDNEINSPSSVDNNRDISKSVIPPSSESESSREVKVLRLTKLVENLEKVAEEAQTKIFKNVQGSRSSGKANGDVTTIMSGEGKKCNSVKAPSITPKKRLFNEVDSSSSKEANNLRPKKKSPNRVHQNLHYPHEGGGGSRTILNIPGLNSEFYKRQTSTKGSKSSTLDSVADLTKYMIKSEPSSVAKRSNRSSPNFGAKLLASPPNSGGSSNSNSVLKSELAAERFSSSGRNASSASSSPTQRHLQEQKQFHQETVTKAISYTINSLLGSGPMANSESLLASSSSSNSKRPAEAGSHHHRHIDGGRASSSPYLSQRESRESSKRYGSPSKNNNNTSSGSQDQNSFLRHLLDTSDPIPHQLKSVDRSNKNSSSLSSSRSNNSQVRDHHSQITAISSNHGSSSGRSSNSSSNSSIKASSSKSQQHHNQSILSSSLNSKGSTVKASSSHGTSHHHSTDPNSLSAEAQQSLATNIALQSLMSLPFAGVASPYELLARAAVSQQQHQSADPLSAAAAAAAALQYGSLLPGNPFNPAAMSNPSMAAAAMMQSYFEMMQPNFSNFTMPTTSSSSNKMPPSSSPSTSSSPAGSHSHSSPPPPPSSKSSSSSNNSIRSRRQQEHLNSHPYLHQQQPRSSSGGSNSSNSSWQGMINGSPHKHQNLMGSSSRSSSSSPSSFRKSAATSSVNSQHRHRQSSPSATVRRSSPSSAILPSSGDIPSYGALNLCAKKNSKAEDIPQSVDLDAPLDLCKKSR